MKKGDKKKILLISRKYPPSTGGMQTYSRNLAENLAKNYDLSKILLGKSQINLIWFLPFCAVVSSLRLLSGRYRLVYLCDALLAPLGVFLKYVFRVKVVITVHGLDITFKNRFYQMVVPWSVSKLDKVICVSRNTMNICMEKGISGDKITFIPNGIETLDANFQEHAASRGLNLLYDVLGGNTCGKKILLTVGRLVARKGIFKFLDEVFPDLGSDYIYFIAGEGPLRHKIEELISFKGLENVHLLGRIEQDVLEALYNKAYAFVMPNIKVENDPEGFGLVAIEAAVRGVPVIAYDVDGISDAVMEGQTGWLIKPGDTQNFIKKLREPEIAKKDIINASKRFEWQNVAKEYYSEIDRLLDKNTSSEEKPGKERKDFISSAPKADQEKQEPVSVFSVTMTPINFPFDDGPKNIVYWIAKTVKKVKFYFISSSSRKGFERFDNMIFINSPFQNRPHHSMSLPQRIFVSFAMLLNLSKIDIFQFFFTPNKLFSFVWGNILKLSGKKSIQIISSVHTFGSLRERADIRSILTSDLIVTQSVYSKKVLEEKGVSNVKTIYPGIDLDRYAPDRYKTMYSSLVKEEEYILYPGNYGLLQQCFSFEEFLSIVRIVSKRNQKIKFVMACRIRNDRDVMLEQTFRKLANEYNVDNNLLYFNTVENMPLLMSSCSIGFLPARKNMIKVLEIPLVILEMSALGKPFIYGKVDPLGELKAKGVGCFPANNEKNEYIALINEYLDKIRDNKGFMPGFREAVLKNFTVKKQAEEFERMYYQLMGEALTGKV